MEVCWEGDGEERWTVKDGDIQAKSDLWPTNMYLDMFAGVHLIRGCDEKWGSFWSDFSSKVCEIQTSDTKWLKPEKIVLLDRGMTLRIIPALSKA